MDDFTGNSVVAGFAVLVSAELEPTTTADTAAAFDSNDAGERSYELAAYGSEFSWILPAADFLAAIFDEDEPLVSPLLTTITIISGCVFDRQSAETADKLNALFRCPNTITAKIQKKLHRIFYRLLIPGFFILLRPSVNLLATSLTIDELLIFYEFAFETCLPDMTIIPVFMGVVFGILVMALKGAVTIMQVYFMAVFTAG